MEHQATHVLGSTSSSLKAWGKFTSLNPIYDDIDLVENKAKQHLTSMGNVSSSHCEIYREEVEGSGHIVFIKDTSTNGTFVDNKLLGKGNKRLISSGTEIAILKRGVPESERIVYVYKDVVEEAKEESDGGPQVDYDIREILGEGNFAVVKKCIHKKTGQAYALKIIDKKKFMQTSQAKRRGKGALMDEVRILSELKHPNTISIDNVYETEEHLYLVLELVTGGELFDKIVATEDGFDEDAARDMFRQMLEGIRYMHSKGIAHRDLKPENILLADKVSNTIKISDFGLSRVIDEKTFMQTMCGTPNYVAPEILTSGGRTPYTKAVDLWSLGVILYILLSGYAPFDEDRQEATGKSLFEQIKTADYGFPAAPWDRRSAEAKDLVRQLLVVKPEQRLTVEQALRHPWIRPEDEGELTQNDDEKAEKADKAVEAKEEQEHEAKQGKASPTRSPKSPSPKSPSPKSSGKRAATPSDKAGVKRAATGEDGPAKKTKVEEEKPLTALTIVELKARLAEFGLPTTGLKQQLIARLTAALEAAP